MDASRGAGLDTFFRDCDEQLAQVEDVLLELEAGTDGGGTDEPVNRAFRIFHSVKGASAMFGFAEIMGFTHQVETVLDRLRSGQLTATRELVDTVLASKDHLVTLVDAARKGQESPDAPAALTRALDALAPAAPRPQVATAWKTPPADALKRFTIRVTGRGEPSFARSLLSGVLEELATLGALTVADAANAADDADGSSERLSAMDLALVTRRSLDEVRDRFIFVESDVDVRVEEEMFFAGPDATVVLFDDADVADNLLRKSLFPPGKAPTVPPRTPSLLLERYSMAPPALLPSAAAPPLPRIASKVPAPPVSMAGASPAAPLAPPAPASGAGERASASAAVDATVRVSSEKLDRLVNLVSELVITQSRLVQVAGRLGDAELAIPVEGIDRLVAELREGVLGIRMTAIGSTFGRFRRLVRDLSRQLGKDVELVTEGADTELDKSVLDQLIDPLMHLVRNALDHGIEPEAERVRRGKPARGRVRLAAAHVGQRVIVTIEDDGKGLDPEAIRAKAIQRGLVSEGAVLSDAQLFELIFLPGFSTAQAVTDVSGRGVGMDVVRKQIDALRGSVRISSTRNQGTRMSLELPLTLAIIDGLLVEVAGDRFIVPLSAVTENVELPAGDRARHNGRRLVLVRDELVPYVSLRELFRAEGTEGKDEKVVLLQVGEDRVGVVVDKVLGSHQTVIQSLGPLFGRVEVVSGATIMGDGKVALILDLAGVVRAAVAERHEAAGAAGAARMAA